MIPIILIAAATVLIVGIAVVLVKSVVTPKRADAVRRLIKQGKNQAAAKLAKQLIAKKTKDYPAHYYLEKPILQTSAESWLSLNLKPSMTMRYSAPPC